MSTFSALESSLAGDDVPMPNQRDTLRIDVVGAQGETVQTIELGQEPVTIGQAPGNQVVLEGNGIGRYHLRLFRAGSRVMVTDLGSRSGTLIGDQRLPPHIDQEWPEGAVMRIGAFRMRLGQRASGSYEGVTLPMRTMLPVESPVDVHFDAGRETLELTPGQSTLVMLVLTNRGREPETPVLSVEGLPTSWITFPPESIVIPANGTINVPLHVQVPRAAESHAGEYSVTIRVRLQRNLVESSIASAHWTVLPFSENLLELRPHKRTVRGRKQTFYILSLQNAGNLSTSYTIRAGDDEPALDYQLDQTRLILEPGAAMTIRLVVQARENPVGRSQTSTFSVQAIPSNGSPLVETGQLHQIAPFPAWALPVSLVSLLLLLLLWAGVMLRNQPTVNAAASASDFQLTPTATETPAATPTLDTSDAIIAPAATPDVAALIHGTETAVAVAAEAQASAIQASEPDPVLQSLQASYERIQSQLEQLMQGGQASSANANGTGNGSGSGSNGGGSSSSGGGDSSSSGGSSGSSSGGGSSGSSNDSSGSSSDSSTAVSTETPTETPTNTPTETPTNTPLNTPTETPTETPTNTPTNTATPSPTATTVPSPTPTYTPLPASRLTFFRQPGSAKGGSLLSQQPAVRVEDSQGNVITTFSGNVVIAIQNDACLPVTRSSVLAGTTTVAVNNGLATFTDLSIDCAGTGYTLQAVASNLPAVVSQPFNVTVGAAHHLVFTSSPEDTRVNATLSPNPQVQIVDSANNLISTATNTIKLTITSGTGTSGANLNGTTSIKAVDGEATFSNLNINRVGSDYTLTATSGSLTGVSTSFNITADRLTFVSSPGNTRANDNLGSIVVQATDSVGTIDTSFTGQVALTLTGGDANASLSNGATTVAANDGVATFSSALKINRVGANYQLQAASGSLTGSSSKFNITADRLVFLNSPGDTRANSDLGSIRVQATDGFGNTDTTFTSNVMLVRVGGTNGAQLTNGATSVNAAGGIADFGTALRVDRVGQSYRIRASSSGMTVDSSAFNITADRLTFSGSPDTTRANTDLGAITVRATDGFGNVDQSFASTISLSLTGGDALATLSNGATSMAAANGVAAFGNSLRIARLGQNYRVVANGGGLSANSSAFNVTADRLRFVNSPGNTQVNVVFAVQPRVVATDGFGNIDNFTTYTISLSLQGGTTGAQLLPAANRSVVTTSGVAIFTGLSVDTIGVNYRLRAVSGSINSDLIQPPTFDIT